MNINGYTLEKELNNANSGFSKWGFAKKGKKEFFLKELLTPVYPIDSSAMSPAIFESRRKFCEEYEQNFKHYYETLNAASHGNLVRIVEFFRSGSKYYVVTEKVDAKAMSDPEVTSLPQDKRTLFLRTVASCFCDLHGAGIIHFDVKPANILIKRTQTGGFAAKLIDFDSGFIKGKKIDVEEICGDLTYLAPETFRAMLGEDVIPDEKVDIFSLGLVFHEYMCGKLPYFDANEYEYPYEATLDLGSLKPDASIYPKELSDLIASMLEADPTKRPSAIQVFKSLSDMTGMSRIIGLSSFMKKTSTAATSATSGYTVTEPVVETPVKDPASSSAEPQPAPSNSGWFASPGDL